ncbi:hypothetical protein C900_05643 [Fulvivirga imtechensis AK7]|uniref:DUF4440 domain-containing protein n=1 Tax=Fulvivirga imtechensis AK7 TaxID=1237149 RepID=L8JJH2_9BACT|nr:DUF4440 domain-containing protein [Fulvivirga imtechensis]ELR68950.1 hypothetical protein C900_05643 [Fulvivirga imtechensis AK7]
MKFIFLTLFAFSAAAYAQDVPEEEIKRQNRLMEEAFNRGDLRAVAEFYLDNAYLLSPAGKVVTERENIDAYWTGIQNPVKWELEVIEVSQSEKAVYENEYWKALKNKPPDWRAAGIDIGTNSNLVYQLGNSRLTVRANDTEHTSEVDFILVWKYTEDGYKILIDTYTWQ